MATDWSFQCLVLGMASVHYAWLLCTRALHKCHRICKSSDDDKCPSLDNVLALLAGLVFKPQLQHGSSLVDVWLAIAGVARRVAPLGSNDPAAM